MADARLNVILTLVDRMTNNLKGVNRTLAQNQDLLKKVSLAASAFSIASVIAIRSFARAALDSRQAGELLQTIIQNIGASYEEFAPIIETTIDKLKRYYSDAELKRALSDLVLAIGDVPLAIASLPVAVDMAKQANIDLGTAAVQIAKFIKGETDTILALGITIDKDVTDPVSRLAFLQDKLRGAAEASITPFSDFNLAMLELKQTLGEHLLPAIEPVLKKLVEFLKILKDLPPGLLAFGAQTIVVATGLAGIVAALSTFLLVWPKVYPALAILFGFATSPLGATLISIATGILLIVNAQTKYAKVHEERIAFLKSMPQTAEEVAEAERKLHERILKGWQDTNEGMTKATDKSKGHIINSWQEMWAVITGRFHAFTVDTSGKYDALFASLIEMGEKGKTKVKKDWDDIEAAVKGATNRFTIDATGKYDALINKLIEMGDQAKAAYDAINRYGGVGSVPYGPPLPPGFGGVFGPPLPSGEIPEMAQGGIVTSPTLAMLGERGPEAVIPLKRGGGLVINFNAPVYGMDNFEKAVAQAVRNTSLRGGFYGVKVGI